MRTHGVELPDSYKDKPVDYVDPAPQPFKVQISLVEFMERIKRIKLDRWQIHFCNYLQSLCENCHIKGSMDEYHAEPQLGKPLDVDSLVLMGDGSYKRLGDVEVGDYVISHAGTPRKVLQVFEQGELDVLQIETGTGRSILSALDHPFLTPEGWVEAKDLRIGQALGCVPEPRTTGASERSCEEFEMLGYFIGDGCVVFANNGSSIQCAITSGDDVLTRRLTFLSDSFGWNYRINRKPGGKCDTVHFSGGAREWVRGTGIAGENSWTKRVPKWVFAGSQKQIEAFVGAYFACDGSFGRQRNTVLEFCSVSIGLLQDLQKLLLRVGVQSRLAIKNGVYKGSRHQSHRLYFCSQDFTSQFISKVPIRGSKGDEMRVRPRFRKAFQAPYLTDNIIAIERAGKRECRCLAVEEDRTFTANDFIVHNTTILSQGYPAWKFGHDPLWREVLAMYNISRAETHSDVIIQIMRGQLYREIFPNKDSHLPSVVSKSGWSTNARLDAENGRMDGQVSFNPVGLQSGITGSGFSGLTIDDPYKDPSEAFSPQIRANLTRFWEFGIEPRLTPNSLVGAMFHRYAYDDFGGQLLDTGKFNYIRYATICDGDYVHESTGQRFPDPLNRKIGEYISERRGPDYYKDKKESPNAWNSMFQGRPSSEEGEFFQVKKMQKVLPEYIQAERDKCVFWVRAWDNAATEGGGDHTAGTKIGIQNDGTVFIDNLILKQYSSERVAQLHKDTAARDGLGVAVCVPLERAQAGKALVYHTEQELKGYTVVSRDVTNNTPGSDAKKRRAYNFGKAVNSGLVRYASDENLAPDDKWNETLLRCMRQFGLSSFDDPIDSTSDGYNYLFEQITRGLVMRTFTPQRNLLGWKKFASIFGEKVPKAWTVYVGAKITNEANRANSALIVARASQNTRMQDTLFVIAEYKDYSADYQKLFDWINTSLKMYCERPKAALISLHADGAETYGSVIRQKLKLGVANFDQDEMAGIAEANWYMMPREGLNPFGSNGNANKTTGLYCLVADDQLVEPKDEQGLYNFRQEVATWGFDDKGEPTKIGEVLDCLRMTTFRFRTQATGLTQLETVEAAMPKAYTIAEMLKKTGKKHLTDGQQIARDLMEQEIRQNLGMTERELPEWADKFMDGDSELERWERDGY